MQMYTLADVKHIPALFSCGLRTEGWVGDLEERS